MQADARPARHPPAPIPLNVVTGFLGSGKTTLLNRLLKDPALAQTAVLINEYGEIGLDHLLVDHVEGSVVMLASGCLCCTVRGDLVDALEKLLRSLDNGRINFCRAIIETTGLADPAPVLHTVMAHPYLTMRFRLDGIIAVVDAVNGAGTLDAHLESVKQIAMADRLVVAKTDLIDARRRGESDNLLARLRGLNPAAPILDVMADRIGADALFNCGLYDPSRKIPDVRRWLAAEAYPGGEMQRHAHHDPHRHGRHDEGIASFVVASDAAIPLAALDMLLDLLRSLHGSKLLRVKGIVNIAEMPAQPVVVHGVQHLFHPPATLAAWPDNDHRTRFVFITRDLDPRPIRELLGAFLNAVGPDRADRTALVDNPLVPFGGADA